MRREGMAERVRGHAPLEAARLHRLREDAGHALARQSPAAQIEEEGPRVTARSRADGRARCRYASTASAAYRPIGTSRSLPPCPAPVHRPRPGRRRPRRARSARRRGAPPVQRLQHGPIAQPGRGAVGRRLQYARYVLHGKGSRERARQTGPDHPAAGSRSASPSRRRNRWNDRTAERVRTTEVARTDERRHASPSTGVPRMPPPRARQPGARRERHGRGGSSRTAPGHDGTPRSCCRPGRAPRSGDRGSAGSATRVRPASAVGSGQVSPSTRSPSSVNGRRCASATPAFVTCPAYAFTPTASAGRAGRRPRAPWRRCRSRTAGSRS